MASQVVSVEVGQGIQRVVHQLHKLRGNAGQKPGEEKMSFD